MKSYSITTRNTDAATVIEIHGRITLGESSRALRQVLEEQVAEGHRRLLLDVAHVSHLDSSGLGSLLVGYNSLKGQGGSIGLLRVPKHIRELLELSRLTTVFQLYESEEEAVK